MGLALTEEYQEELAFGSKGNWIKHIRDMDYSVMIWRSFRPMQQKIPRR